MLLQSKYFILLVSLVFLLPVERTFSQFGPETASEKAAAEQINNELKSRFGENSYKVNHIIDVNYRMGNYKFYLTPLEDPYGTLENCFIFITDTDGTAENTFRPHFKVIPMMIGIYKDGAIIWLSEREIGEYGDGHVLLTRDLNSDGIVEIITEWTVGRVGSNLWIHSWDGNTGWRINKIEDPNWPYFSELSGIHHSWGWFDFEGDGIWEIKNYDGKTYDTFSWNGSQYGQWQDTPQYTGNEWLPRNNMQVKVNCKVIKENGEFQYTYNVENLPVSKQRINTIYVQVKTDSFTTQVPNNDWKRKLHYLYDLDGWAIKAFGGKGYIEPGNQINGFIKRSQALPIISKYFVRADNALPDIVSMDDEEYESGDRPDITNNSVVGNTIGLSEPPNPFIILDFVDSLKTYSDSLHSLGWIQTQETKDKYNSHFNNAKNYLQQNNNNAAKSELLLVLNECNEDSSSVLTSEAYALLKFNTEYLLTQIPEEQTYPYLKVNFKDSEGSFKLDGSLQYYDSGWKDAVNNGDGTFNVKTEKTAITLRMHYGGASQTVSNVQAQNKSFTFTTVKTIVQLLNSQNELLLDPSGNGGTATPEVGQVQYYASGWKEYGNAVNGEATKELLPKEYSFRMNYGGASIDQKQDIGLDQIVVFRTVNAKVQLQDSQGNLFPVPLVDGGTATPEVGQVQYYASGWKEFGNAVNGEAAKELLPKEYSFRMNYGGASIDQKQDIGLDQIVVFRTVNAKVQLQDSQGNLLSRGSVQYYASGWKDFGEAIDGEAVKELLSKEYSFRIKYGGASLDQKQNIGTDATVVFQTINTKVQLQDSQGNLLSGGSVQYYASGWKDFGEAIDGEAVKELLSKEYSFRMNYDGASQNKKQEISTNIPVVFSTVNCIIRVVDASNQPINNALASYYASGWKEIGITENGKISKELLPRNYSFRVNNNGVNQNKQQDITNNNIVEFIY